MAYVNQGERAEIKGRAKALRMSVSAYIRAACLGHEIEHPANLDAIALLSKVHADQGRIGGLLKMYLQDREPDRRTAERLLADLDRVRSELTAAAQRIVPAS
jgi:hypothetical protein